MTGVQPLGDGSPLPDEDDLRIIVVAVEEVLRRRREAAASAVAKRPPHRRWRFSGRTWAAPGPLLRDRPLR